jgi:hypothetical protein
MLNHRHMPDLTRESVASNIQMIVGNDCPSYSRPNGEHDDVPAANRNSVHPLGEQGAVGIILHKRRGACRMGHNLADRYVANTRHIWGKREYSPPLVDHSCAAHTGCRNDSPLGSD